MAIELLAPTASAADSLGFRVRTGKDKVAVYANPVLGAGEECHLEVSVDNGQNWTQYIADVMDGDTPDNIHVIDFPGHFRIAKDSTASPTGIYLEGKAVIDSA